VEDAVQKSLMAGAGFGLALAAGYGLIGDKRRAELMEIYKPHQKETAVVLLMAIVALTSCTGDSRQPDLHENQLGSDIFIGTPLEGAQVTGRVGELLDIYGPKAIDYVRSTNEYYDKISDNLVSALSDYKMPLENSENIVTALVISDLHCNINMAKP